MKTETNAAREFIYRSGRLLDQRLYATLFEGGQAADVLSALRAYQNRDGGFGHALEPDTRCPYSLPIYVETALGVMAAVGIGDSQIVSLSCDYLSDLSDRIGSSGAVPLATPVIEGFPRAAHWAEWTYIPGLNPTAGIVGHLHELGAEHPWMDEAAEYCWGQIEDAGLGGDAHTLSETLLFLQHVPDRPRAHQASDGLEDILEQTPMLRLDPASEGYGLTPLHIAPSPDSPWHNAFSPDHIHGHLDQMQRDQQADGGWPIRWEPPSGAALLEWRSVETIRALTVLRAYGRLD